MALVLLIALDIILGSVLFVWAFSLSAPEYINHEHEVKYFTGALLALIALNVLYWLH
jgi:hypothetical protein